MIFRNFLRIKEEDPAWPDGLITRRTNYLLYIVLLGLLLCIGLTVFLIIGALQIAGEAEPGIIFFWMVNVGFGTAVLVLSIVLWLAAMKWMVAYFYGILIVSEERVVKIKFNLLFEEKVKVLELYRILSLHSVQDGIVRGMLGFGNVVMRIQNSGTLVAKNMPRPKKIVTIIEAFKEHITEERFDLDEDERDHINNNE